MNKTDPIRVIIADDEPLARDLIRRFLANESDIQVIGEASSGPETVAAIRKLNPDLVFLDIRMPELDGFKVIEALEPKSFPALVFVTAYSQYAVQAFEAQAIDYLLKPFDRSRFRAALERARQQIAREPLDETITIVKDLLARLQTQPQYLQKLTIKEGGRVVFIPTESVRWIESAGKYARIHTENRTHLVRQSMKALEGALNPGQFLRIHRSSIVSIDAIGEIHPWFHGDFRIILKNGTILTTGKSYRGVVRQLCDSLGLPAHGM